MCCLCPLVIVLFVFIVIVSLVLIPVVLYYPGQMHCVLVVFFSSVLIHHLYFSSLLCITLVIYEYYEYVSYAAFWARFVFLGVDLGSCVCSNQ